MNLSVPALVGFMVMTALTTSPSLAQTPQDEPTKQEIAFAYRSKTGQYLMPIPGVRLESWRIKEIRGWSLKFKHLSDSRLLGAMTIQYRAVARKNGSCAAYLFTERMPLPPVNVQIKPMLVVELGGVAACR